MAFARQSTTGRVSARRRAPGSRARPVAAAPVLRRKAGACACGGGCPRCEQASPEVTEGVERLEGEGHPLPARDRAFFEPRLGRDLSGVRVHDDPRAASLAGAAGARAFTVGDHIVLGRAEGSDRRLMAHELAHTVQQGEGPGSAGGPRVQRITNQQCTAGGCGPPDRCTGIQADLDRAEDYVADAIAALSAATPSDSTTQAIRWYFHRESDTASHTLRDRFDLIRTVLLQNDLFGDMACHAQADCPGDALAYVRTATPPDTPDFDTINLCETYFSKNDRYRAIILIHEASHLIGMSVSTDDVYDHTMRFRSLTTQNAILNADSYALFASAIDRGSIGASFLITEGGAAGAVFGGPGDAGWYASLYIEGALQHPVLHVFNPTLRVSATAMGVPESGEGRSFDESLIVSVLPGLRLENPRPSGAAGSLSFFGGPSVMIRSGEDAAIGAQAGVGIGFRWRWLDVGAEATYTYDPTAAEGSRDLIQLGGRIGFNFGAGAN